MMMPMGQDVVLQVGVTTFTAEDLRFFAFCAFAGLGIGLVPGVWWRLRDWRIRRARAAGKDDIADILALDHDEENRPKSFASILPAVAFMIVGVPALTIFQQNFADDAAELLGERFAWAAMPLAFALVTGCFWMWDRIRRNFMSLEERAALEEQEEHQRWMDEFVNGAHLSPAILGVVFLLTIAAILAAMLAG